jgi:hypothetical protein
MNNSSDGTLTAAKLWLSLYMEEDLARRREDEMTIETVDCSQTVFGKTSVR